MRVTRSSSQPITWFRIRLWRAIKQVWQSIGPARLIRGFGGFEVLVAGARLGLFDLLERRPGLSHNAIAAELHLPLVPTEALLLASTSLGLTRRNRRTGTYRNAMLLSRFLHRERRGTTLPTVEAFHELLYPAFHRTAESLRAGRNLGLDVIGGQGATLYERLESDPARKRVFHGWMDAMGSGTPKLPAAVRAAMADRRRVLDVGGGDGRNAAALAQLFPRTEVTVFDLPLACTLTNETAARAGLSARVHALPGNFLTDALPRGFDAIMIAHIFNIYSRDANRALIRRCAEALPAGGKLVIYNLVSDDDRTGSWHAGFMSLYFQILATGEGMVYPPSDYEPWFRDAGFRSLRIDVEPQSGEGVFVGTV